MVGRDIGDVCGTLVELNEEVTSACARISDLLQGTVRNILCCSKAL